MERMKNILTAQDYDQDHYKCEYLVIGSGAGGGLSGYELANAGKEVIILEEGKYHPRSSFKPEVASMTSRLYRNGGVFPFLGSPSVGFAEGKCVGGTTVINGALFWRTPAWILKEWREQHGLSDLTQEKLAPHFLAVENDLHVTQHDLEKEANLDSTRIKEGADELGWKVVMAPRAVKDCINENWCPTGCLHGGKQSVLETYLPRSIQKGARIFSELKAEKIHHSGSRANSVTARIQENSRIVKIEFQHLIVAAGALQTPHLLRKNKLSKLAGKELQFHLNLKMVALHRDPIHAEQGTIFTTQIQEFEKEGLLIMASNMKPHYLAMTLAHFDNNTIDEVIDRSDHCGIYVGMIRPQSKAKVISKLGKDPLVHYKFHPNDQARIKKALSKTCEVLFASDVKKIYLPLANSSSVHSMEEVQANLRHMKPKDAQMISVHAMSSCPMGTNPENSVVNPKGYLWNMENVLVTDASILPGNIGESPQGTIMGLTRKIITEHLQEPQ